MGNRRSWSADKNSNRQDPGTRRLCPDTVRAIRFRPGNLIHRPGVNVNISQQNKIKINVNVNTKIFYNEKESDVKNFVITEESEKQPPAGRG